MWADATKFLSALLGPVLNLIAPLHPVWQGAVLGVPIGVLALLIYRLTSDQTDITRTKDGIKANLLALQLFRDDLRVLLRTQVAIFRLVGRYLRLGLVPLAILIVPVLLLLVQVEARHGHRPVQVGEATNVVVELADSTVPTETSATLRATDTLRVETPAFRRDAERMVAWRVRWKFTWVTESSAGRCGPVIPGLNCWCRIPIARRTGGRSEARGSQRLILKLTWRK
jgi:hypothetical protein